MKIRKNRNCTHRNILPVINLFNFIIYLYLINNECLCTYNNLNQLEYYLNNYKVNDLLSDLYKDGVSCEIGTGAKVTNCIEWKTTQLLLSHPDLYQYNDNLHNKNKSIIKDCLYEFEIESSISIINNEKYFHYKIYQSDCKLNHSIGLGGSSIQVISSSRYMESCIVNDNFDNSYNIYCQYNNKIIHTQCTVLTVTIDYEHFDAYSNINIFYEAKLKPLRYILINFEKVCVKNNYKIKHVDIKTEINSDNINDISNNIFNGNWYINNENIINSENIINNIEWKFYIPLEINNRSNYNIFNSNKKIMMIGSSHMRYQWDGLILELNNPSIIESFHHLDRKHLSSTINDITFKHILFSSGIVKYLDEMCDLVVNSNYNLNYLIFIQFGSWDISEWPIEKLFYGGNNSQIQLVFNQIEKLILRNCSINMDLIFITPPTHPYICKVDNITEPYSEVECALSRGRSRNHYTVLALSFFMEKNINKIKIKNKYNNLYLIDVNKIISPLLNLDDVVAKNHYMTRENSSSSMKFTKAGRIILDCIKRAFFL